MNSTIPCFFGVGAAYPLSFGWRCFSLVPPPPFTFGEYIEINRLWHAVSRFATTNAFMHITLFRVLLCENGLVCVLANSEGSQDSCIAWTRLVTATTPWRTTTLIFHLFHGSKTTKSPPQLSQWAIGNLAAHVSILRATCFFIALIFRTQCDEWCRENIMCEKVR